MELTFLGTGGVHGIPAWNCSCFVCKSKNPKNKRFRSALFIKIGNKNISIDCGPDYRSQLLKNKITKLDYVFVTHAHSDHINGAMELSRQKNLKLESSKQVLKEMRRRWSSSNKWLETRNPTIKIQEFKSKVILGVKVDQIKLEHQKDYTKEPTACVGYVFKSKKFKFAYLSDYSKILEPEKLKDLDLLISDGNNMKTKHGHVGVEGSIKVYNQFKPKKMLLTHIRHTEDHTKLSNYVKKFGNINVAYDGLIIKK